VRAFNADPAENALSSVEAHTAVGENDGEFHDKRICTVALEELNVFECVLQYGKL
jgi:hypothetical protein